MIDVLLFFILIHWGVMVICDKYNLMLKIGDLANIIPIRWLSKLIYGVSVCYFCYSHHIGAIIVLPIIYYYFSGWAEILLVYPFLSASFINIIQRLSNEKSNN